MTGGYLEIQCSKNHILSDLDRIKVCVSTVSNNCLHF